MSEYKKIIDYLPCAYCEEIINLILSEDTFMDQYKLIKSLKGKMNEKTVIKHVNELIDKEILIDYSNPPDLLFFEIEEAFLGKSEYGNPTRVGWLDFNNENDRKLLKKVLEGSKKRQRRVYVLWFNYDWLVKNRPKTSTHNCLAIRQYCLEFIPISDIFFYFIDRYHHLFCPVLRHRTCYLVP